jgi:hypothetical protein
VGVGSSWLAGKGEDVKRRATAPKHPTLLSCSRKDIRIDFGLPRSRRNPTRGLLTIEGGCRRPEMASAPRFAVETLSRTAGFSRLLWRVREFAWRTSILTRGRGHRRWTGRSPKRRRRAVNCDAPVEALQEG